MTLFIPILIVCIVGIVAGVLLTIAAKIMYVPVDERVEQLTEALPGANCGGCGFAGCSDYANAIVGTASTCRCARWEVPRSARSSPPSWG